MCQMLCYHAANRADTTAALRGPAASSLYKSAKISCRVSENDAHVGFYDYALSVVYRLPQALNAPQ